MFIECNSLSIIGFTKLSILLINSENFDSTSDIFDFVSIKRNNSFIISCVFCDTVPSGILSIFSCNLIILALRSLYLASYDDIFSNSVLIVPILSIIMSILFVNSDNFDEISLILDLSFTILSIFILNETNVDLNFSKSVLSAFSSILASMYLIISGDKFGCMILLIFIVVIIYML